MDYPRFFVPPLSGLGEQELPEATAHYMARVLRMQPGAIVQVFDGNGDEFLAKLIRNSKRTVVIEVLEQLPDAPSSALQIQLGQALSRGDRMDWAIQKATELGVGGVTPLISERSQVRLNDERTSKKQQHWQQVAVSACEQCGRRTVPPVEPVTGLADWVSSQSADLKLVLHPRAPGLGEFVKPEKLSLLIGPEGGLSDTELENAQKYGFRPVSLGPRVLRTETAPVVALSIAQHLWGDL